MAQAGASLIQVYTLFGYRGVGTPRLLKDEITQALLGHTWKNQIGTEWEGQQMGWDEKRLEKENEALRKEAEGLGAMLRSLKEKEDLQSLVKEVEEALKGVQRAQPRDNLMGSQGPSTTNEGEKVEKKAEGALEKVERGAERVGNALEQAIVGAIEAARPRGGNETESAPAQEAIQTRPSPGKEQDDFTRTVRTGQRRLV
jgi:dihydroorotate dehydrogenase